MSARPATTLELPRSLRALLVVVILGLLGGGIAAAVERDGPSDTSSPHQPTALPSPSVTSPQSSTPTPAPTNPDLFTPPATFTWVSDDVAGTGPIDAARAAQLDGTGASSAVGLQQLGFLRGVSRQWKSPAGTLVELVYTFAQGSQATAYVATAVATRRNDPAFLVVPSPATTPVGGVTLTNTTNTSSSVVMLFASGTHAVVMGLVNSGSEPDRAALAALASQQAAFSLMSP